MAAAEAICSATKELSPRLVEALVLVGLQVVGVSVGCEHAADGPMRGSSSPCHGYAGNLGHGGHHEELVPRLVEALVGKKVVGASSRESHTAVWTETGELFTFGAGDNGKLGHGGKGDERVPRLVEALVGKKVVGASAGDEHTAAWTDEGAGGALHIWAWRRWGARPRWGRE